MTIEERAKQAATEVCGGNEFYISGYIDGATEQQAIDEEFYTAEMLRVEREAKEQRLITIGKACEWLKNELNGYDFYLQRDVDAFVDDFRKAMTTKFDPLFEECLAMVDSEIRAEVRANMEKED